MASKYTYKAHQIGASNPYERTVYFVATSVDLPDPASRENDLGFCLTEGTIYEWSGSAWVLIYQDQTGASGSTAWGAITGTLANQTDLKTALDGKAALSHTHTEIEITNLTADLVAREVIANKGAINGYCGLDASQKVGIGNLPTGSTSLTVCIGNDARLSDSRTPLAHATSHKSGGSDPIKLDELAAPTDITTLNASSTAHGLLPKLSNVATQFLDGSGIFDAVKDSDLSLSDITTNNASTSNHGLLRKLDGTTTNFLRGDGTWSTVPTGSVTAPITGAQAPGSFTIADGQFGLQGKRLKLITTDRGTIAGTGRLVISG